MNKNFHSQINLKWEKFPPIFGHLRELQMRKQTSSLKLMQIIKLTKPLV